MLRTKQNLRYLFLVALLGTAAILSLYQDTIINKLFPPEVAQTEVNEIDEDRFVPVGTLHFTASQAGKTALASYTYDLATEAAAPQLEGFPMIHATPADDHTSVALIRDLDTTSTTSADYLKVGYLDYDTEEYFFFDLPALYDERDITPDASATAVAYSAAPELITSNEWVSLENWQVVLHIPEEDYTHTIDNAAHPQWLEGNTTVVYLKTDGVYAYNRLTDTETKLIGAYTDLSFYDDIDLSVTEDDGDSEGILVVTVPSLGVVDVVYIDDVETVTQIGRIETSDTFYTEPAVNPEATGFAVVTRFDSGAPPEITIYDLSVTAVQTISLPDFNIDRMSMDGWGV